MYLDVNLFWSVAHVLAHHLRSVYAHTCDDTVWAPPIFFLRFVYILYSLWSNMVRIFWSEFRSNCAWFLRKSFPGFLLTKNAVKETQWPKTLWQRAECKKDGQSRFHQFIEIRFHDDSNRFMLLCRWFDRRREGILKRVFSFVVGTRKHFIARPNGLVLAKEIPNEYSIHPKRLIVEHKGTTTSLNTVKPKTTFEIYTESKCICNEIEST